MVSFVEGSANSDLHDKAWPCKITDFRQLAECLHNGQSWGVPGITELPTRTDLQHYCCHHYVGVALQSFLLDFFVGDWLAGKCAHFSYLVLADFSFSLLGAISGERAFLSDNERFFILHMCKHIGKKPPQVHSYRNEIDNAKLK